jgi:hypothetical protein
VQFQATYRFKTHFDDGTLRDPDWGQLLALVEGNLDLQAFWKASGYTIPRGGGVLGYWELFQSPELGIWFQGNVEWGRLYVNSDREYHWQGLEVGVGWWTTSSLELRFSASVSSVAASTSGSTSLVTGLGNFGIVTRAPKRLCSQPEPPESNQPRVISPQVLTPPAAQPEAQPLPIPESELPASEPAPSSPATEMPPEPGIQE